MTEIDPLVWYMERELPFPPRHFVKASTTITPESVLWIKTNLTGRFCISSDTTIAPYSFAVLRPCVYFESPAECMMFELRWSSSK